MADFVTLLACAALIGWIYLAFFHGGFWQPLLDEPAPEPSKWPAIDIIVPARDEAEALPGSLPSLLAQDYPGEWKIILVDDHSEDGTAALARKLAESKNLSHRLTVIAAPDLPQGWGGKVAAMQAGVDQSNSEYILFTDADIEHPVDSLRRLAARAVERKLDLVSRMVKLHCVTTAEKLLIPAFVFFFAVLYPFGRVNDPDSPVAGAAGGVMLLRRKALDGITGLRAIKSSLIDDCALARAIKRYSGKDGTPGRIELTMTRDIKSLRVYPEIKDARYMIARTAFTQLNHSRGILIATITVMAILFLVPVLVSVTGLPLAAEAALGAWVVMSMIYMPMVRFYGLPLVWALALPLAALIYMAATIDSAKLYWQGKGGQWKGRTQA